MQLRVRFVVRWLAVLVAVALWAGATVGFAQRVISTHDEFGSRTLSVDRWRVIIPHTYVDRNSTRLMVDWQYPDGTGRGFGFRLDDPERVRGYGLDPLSPHDTFVWMREGDVADEATRPCSWDLPGYALEWTEAMITWWAGGGDGSMEAVGGDWVEFDCPGTDPPAQANGTPEPDPVCPAGMNPFEAAAAGCRIVVGGSGSPAPMSKEVRQAYEAYDAAKALCETNSTAENCAARDRAYQALVAFMGRGP